MGVATSSLAVWLDKRRIRNRDDVFTFHSKLKTLSEHITVQHHSSSSSSSSLSLPISESISS